MDTWEITVTFRERPWWLRPFRMGRQRTLVFTKETTEADALETIRDFRRQFPDSEAGLRRGGSL